MEPNQSGFDLRYVVMQVGGALEGMTGPARFICSSGGGLLPLLSPEKEPPGTLPWVWRAPPWLLLLWLQDRFTVLPLFQISVCVLPSGLSLGFWCYLELGPVFYCMSCWMLVCMLFRAETHFVFEYGRGLVGPWGLLVISTRNLPVYSGVGQCAFSTPGHPQVPLDTTSDPLKLRPELAPNWDNLCNFGQILDLPF